MIKKYNKKDLTFKDGYIWNKEEIVPVDESIVMWFNELEQAKQKTKFDKANKETPKAEKVFKFESQHEVKIEIPEAKTPTLDKRVEEAKAIMKENDLVQTTDKAKALLNCINSEVKEFIGNDYFLTSETKAYRFDVKTIGDPLKLTSKDLVKLVMEISEE